MMAGTVLFTNDGASADVLRYLNAACPLCTITNQFDKPDEDPGASSHFESTVTCGQCESVFKVIFNGAFKQIGKTQVVENNVDKGPARVLSAGNAPMQHLFKLTSSESLEAQQELVQQGRNGRGTAPPAPSTLDAASLPSVPEPDLSIVPPPPQPLQQLPVVPPPQEESSAQQSQSKAPQKKKSLPAQAKPTKQKSASKKRKKPEGPVIEEGMYIRCWWQGEEPSQWFDAEIQKVWKTTGKVDLWYPMGYDSNQGEEEKKVDLSEADWEPVDYDIYDEKSATIAKAKLSQAPPKAKKSKSS